MLRLLIATSNPDKLREIHGILAHLPLELLSLRDFAWVPEPEETGATFAENARLKALYYDAAIAGADLKVRPYNGSNAGRGRQDVRAGISAFAEGSGETSPKRERGGGQAGPVYTIAEDSGLEVDALGREPGVRSARFLRPDATYPERFAEIQRRLSARPSAPRTARFVCAVAVVHAGEVVYETTGVVEGQIAPEARGENGFGYDPIFYYPPYGRTLGETTEDEKARVAHRGNAFRQLARWLSERQFRERT